MNAPARQPATACRYPVFAYCTRAVNRLGVESGPSPYALTIPEQPDLPGLVAAEPGRGMRRYYVVAVDALGQEGIASAGARAFRESTARWID